MINMHPSIFKRLFHPSKFASMNSIPIILFLFLTLISHTLAYSVQLGLKWGEKCKIPGPNEFLKASEECEMSRGLHCQVYQQGNLCGCPIRGSLSYDERSGECRRKPGHHCPYLNTTVDPGAYDNHPYNHRCHTRAECIIVEPIPDMGTSSKSKPKKSEQFAVCRCRPGYKESRDGLVCHSVNSSDKMTMGMSSFMYGLSVLLVTRIVMGLLGVAVR